MRKYNVLQKRHVSENSRTSWAKEIILENKSTLEMFLFASEFGGKF
jgi:hypothetical protein